MYSYNDYASRIFSKSSMDILETSSQYILMFQKDMSGIISLLDFNILCTFAIKTEYSRNILYYVGY